MFIGNNEIMSNNTELTISATPEVNPSQIIEKALQLSEKDRNQLRVGFQSGSYEMATAYLWKKTLDSLKKQLGSVGLSFVSELLGRVGGMELIDYREIPDYDALRLAEELGLVTGSNAFRLKQSMEMVNFYASGDMNQDSSEGMNVAEAASILYACVKGVLSQERFDAVLDFKLFRDDLEGRTMSESDDYIQKLITMPYFYKRTTVSILISIIEKDSGAQLENALANANQIIPIIWDSIHSDERFLVGRCYADMYAAGKTTALSGIKKILLKVKGFDYVPEDLRSRAFIAAANKIINAHFSFDNFYLEPAAVNSLYKMGSVIPTPALSSCVCALLCVRLGNIYGVSFDAQKTANQIMANITKERWEYYFKECFMSDDKVLMKLTISKIAERWVGMFNKEFYSELIPSMKDKLVGSFLEATVQKNVERVCSIARHLYSRLGYMVNN